MNSSCDSPDFDSRGELSFLRCNSCAIVFEEDELEEISLLFFERLDLAFGFVVPSFKIMSIKPSGSSDLTSSAVPTLALHSFPNNILGDERSAECLRFERFDVAVGSTLSAELNGFFDAFGVRFAKIEAIAGFDDDDTSAVGFNEDFFGVLVPKSSSMMDSSLDFECFVGFKGEDSA